MNDRTACHLDVHCAEAIAVFRGKPTKTTVAPAACFGIVYSVRLEKLCAMFGITSNLRKQHVGCDVFHRLQCEGEIRALNEMNDHVLQYNYASYEQNACAQSIMIIQLSYSFVMRKMENAQTNRNESHANNFVSCAIIKHNKMDSNAKLTSCSTCSWFR